MDKVRRDVRWAVEVLGKLPATGREAEALPAGRAEGVRAARALAWAALARPAAPRGR